MVHLRLNDPDTSRNPHINFISSLPSYADHDTALHILQRLAALFKPIMKSHGLSINSLEEYEPNREFLGRNFEAGQNVEMVLRRHGGGFLPFGFVCSVFAHELAHNVHMNHVPSRHGKLTRELNGEWKELRRKGYEGDGFWSKGRTVGGAVGMDQDVRDEDVPEGLCGGAWRKKAKGRKAGAAKRKRKNGSSATSSTLARHKKGQPSLHTGAQTAVNTSRTAGKRRAYVELPGSGSRVDGRNYIPTASAKSNSYKEDENSTFRKRANTHAARDARAAAAMRRMNTLARAQEEVSNSKDIKVQTAAGRPAANLTAWLNMNGGGASTSAEGKDEESSISRMSQPGAFHKDDGTVEVKVETAADDGDADESVTEDESDSVTENELYESSSDESTPVSLPLNDASSFSESTTTSSQPQSHSHNHKETAESRRRRTAKARQLETSLGNGGADREELNEVLREARREAAADRLQRLAGSRIQSGGVEPARVEKPLQPHSQPQAQAKTQAQAQPQAEARARPPAVDKGGAEPSDEDEVVFVEMKGPVKREK